MRAHAHLTLVAMSSRYSFSLVPMCAVAVLLLFLQLELVVCAPAGEPFWVNRSMVLATGWSSSKRWTVTPVGSAPFVLEPGEPKNVTNSADQFSCTVSSLDETCDELSFFFGDSLEAVVGPEGGVLTSFVFSLRTEANVTGGEYAFGASYSDISSTFVIDTPFSPFPNFTAGGFLNSLYVNASYIEEGFITGTPRLTMELFSSSSATGVRPAGEYSFTAPALRTAFDDNCALALKSAARTLFDMTTNGGNVTCSRPNANATTVCVLTCPPTSFTHGPASYACVRGLLRPAFIDAPSACLNFSAALTPFEPSVTTADFVRIGTVNVTDAATGLLVPDLCTSSFLTSFFLTKAFYRPLGSSKPFAELFSFSSELSMTIGLPTDQVFDIGAYQFIDYSADVSTSPTLSLSAAVCDSKNPSAIVLVYGYAFGKQRALQKAGEYLVSVSFRDLATSFLVPLGTINLIVRPGKFFLPSAVLSGPGLSESIGMDNRGSSASDGSSALAGLPVRMTITARDSIGNLAENFCLFGTDDDVVYALLRKADLVNLTYATSGSSCVPQLPSSTTHFKDADVLLIVPDGVLDLSQMRVSLSSASQGEIVIDFIAPVDGGYYDVSLAFFIQLEQRRTVYARIALNQLFLSFSLDDIPDRDEEEAGKWDEAVSWRVESYCGNGFVCPIDRLGPCIACGFDTYNDNSSATACTVCPSGLRAAPGSSSVRNCSCSPGDYMPRIVRENVSAIPECLPCPRGASCAGGFAVPVALPGFYPLPSSEAEFVACVRPNSCVGAGLCAAWHGGFRCDACLPGSYGRTPTQTCQPCPSLAGGLLASMVLASLAVGVLGLVYTVWRLRRSAYEEARLHPRPLVPYALSAGLTFCQILALLRLPSLSWPQPASSAMGVLAVASFDLASASATASCLVPDAFSLYTFRMAMPLVCLMAIVLGAVLYGVLVGRHRGAEWPGAARAVELTYFILGPLLYLPMATLTLSHFGCTQLADGAWYLDGAPGTRCFTGRWTSVLPVALAGLGLYVCLLPAYMLVHLARRRGAPLRDAAVLARFGTLYTRYWSRLWYWEIVVMARRLATVLTTTFASSFPLLMVFLLELVFSISASLTLRLHPFYRHVHNTIDTLVSLVLCALLLIGFGFSADVFTSASARGFFAVLAMMLIVLCLVALACLAVEELRGRRGADRTAHKANVAFLALAQDFVSASEMPALEAELDRLAHHVSSTAGQAAQRSALETTEASFFTFVEPDSLALSDLAATSKQ